MRLRSSFEARSRQLRALRSSRVLRYTPSLTCMDMTPNSAARASCHGGLATAGKPLLSCSVVRTLAMDSTSSSPLSWRSPGQLLVSAAHQCSHSSQKSAQVRQTWHQTCHRHLDIQPLPNLLKEPHEHLSSSSDSGLSRRSLLPVGGTDIIHEPVVKYYLTELVLRS